MQTIFEYIESIGEHAADQFFGDVCVYGLNCGQYCVSNGTSWDDPLDTACLVHDQCLDAAGDDREARCDCHNDLENEAETVVNYGADCSWWKVWCEEPDIVPTAATIATAMRIQQGYEKCGAPTR